MHSPGGCAASWMREHQVYHLGTQKQPKCIFQRVAIVQAGPDGSVTPFLLLLESFVLLVSKFFGSTTFGSGMITLSLSVTCCLCNLHSYAYFVNLFLF